MTSNIDIVHFIAVITLGIVIGIGIGLRGFPEKDDHLKSSNTTKTFRSAHGIYKNAAVASDAKICSDIGRDVMEIDGGNAIDAAIAVQFCSGVLHSHNVGIGGGMFALVYHKKYGMHAIDGREAAPLAASTDMFSKPEFRAKAKSGGLSVGIPGLLKGYIEMHSRFGSLPWKRLLTPTIDILRNGFPLTELSYDGLIRQLSPNKEKMKGFEMFLDETNQMKQVDSIIRMPKLARTMERIAEDPMSFYKGSLAQDILSDLKDEGGIITQEDLNKYQALVKKPTVLDLPGGRTLYSVPSPSAGPRLSYILSILSDGRGGGDHKSFSQRDHPFYSSLIYRYKRLGIVLPVRTGYNMSTDNWASQKAKTETYHRFIEALKFSIARKTELGDENFVDVKAIVKNLTSRAYGEETRLRIKDSRTFDFQYYGPKFYSAKEHGTSHAAIVDREGNAVSMTGSINTYFGSQVVGERTGIIFNNQMHAFSHPYMANYRGLQPAEANFIQPGKRPSAGMCPAIIWDNIKNRVSIVTGGGGGHKITSAVASTLMNILWFNMSVPESLDQARVFHELVPNAAQTESSLHVNIFAGLEKKGHNFLRPLGVSVVQMIQVLEDAIVAGCDFRKMGEPSGF